MFLIWNLILSIVQIKQDKVQKWFYCVNITVPSKTIKWML